MTQSVIKQRVTRVLLFLAGCGFCLPIGNSFATVSFTGPTPFSVGDHPSTVAIGDFNLDGKLDLAVTNSGGNNNTVSILMGDINGNFTQATNSPFSVGIGPYSVAIGDFNRDGKPDLAVANCSSNNVSIRLNTTTP